MVRGVIEAYWAWCSPEPTSGSAQQQVIQGTAALRPGRGETRRWAWATVAEVAQARSALAEFKAARDHRRGERAAARETRCGTSWACRPSTPHADRSGQPAVVRARAVDWDAIVAVAAERRPDLIELKLIIEADQQRLLMAENDALPSVDLNGLYRWNGLEGRTPDQRDRLLRAGPIHRVAVGREFLRAAGLAKGAGAAARNGN